jgi:hypothetical protein
MARIASPIFALVAAVMAATLFGSTVHDWLGISRDAIRTDALVSATFICIAVACGALLKQNR